MKRIAICTMVLLALVGLATFYHHAPRTLIVHAQYIPQVTGQNTLFASATSGPAGIVTNPGNNLIVQVTPGPMFCSGDQLMLHNIQLGLLANQTWYIVAQCANNAVIARAGLNAPGNRPTEIPLATVVCGATSCGTITATTATTDYPNEGDNFFWLPLGGSDGCTLALTTGTFAANPANSGGLSAPSLVRAQTNNVVYELTTTAATNTSTLDCAIFPPSKTSTGKGVLVTGLNVFYGVQTTALTSIVATPTLDTVTYAATAGGAAAGTVAAAGGTLTFTPAIASAQLATTTSGQCYQQNVTLATPVQLNSAIQTLIFEEQFAQSAAAATVLQICGVQVLYQNIPL